MLRHRIELWIALALGLSAAACAGTARPQPATPEIAPAPAPTTLDRSEVRALADLLRLEDRREYDEALLSTYLTATHPELRRRAAGAAGRTGDSRATTLLIQALADPEPEVRAEAAFALGQLGDSASHIIGALAARALDPAEAAAPRIEAVAALGKLRTVEARITVELLLERAVTAKEDNAPPTAVVAEALLATWKFRRAAGLTDPLVPLSRSPDPELRWRATYALMRLGDPATVGALLERRADADPLVRALAMRGLRPAVVDSADRRAPSLSTLSEASRDPHPHVRINALRALASYQLAEYTGVLAEALADPDINVAIAAAEALGQNGAGEAAPALGSVASSATAPLALRAAALTSLLRLDPEGGLPLAEKLARGDDWLTRLYLARVLAAAPEQRGVALLTELAHDPDPRVVGAALGSLGELPPDETPGLRRLFIEQLGAADVGIRAAALQALARRATAADLSALLDAYGRATHDAEMNDAARAAITALGTLAAQGIPVQRAFFHRFTRSADPIVRRDVQEKLGAGDWGPIYPVTTNRDLPFYEEVIRNLVVPALAGAPRPQARIHTGHGAITVELDPAAAPLTVYNFTTLADAGYFNGHRWHRVVPNFVLQDGDPRGDGSGGPGYAIRDEINRLRYLRGTVGMALDGPDTGGSQYFITHAPQPHLDGGYTIFGQVVAGLEVADRIVQDDPIRQIEILRSVAAKPNGENTEW